MEQTTNNNIKIVRLQSGEDIIANYHSDDENGIVLLENPMHIIFKRMPTGQSVMMMMPWLPIEIIKENSAIVYDSDILTMFEPKEELITHYGDVVLSAQERLENDLNVIDYEGDEDDESYEDDETEISTEEIFEILKEKKKSKLH